MCWAPCSDLRHGRDQFAKGPYVLAEVRCVTKGSFWPRSGTELWLLRVADRKSCNADTRDSRDAVGGRWRETDLTRTVQCAVPGVTLRRLLDDFHTFSHVKVDSNPADNSVRLTEAGFYCTRWCFQRSVVAGRIYNYYFLREVAFGPEVILIWHPRA